MSSGWLFGISVGVLLSTVGYVIVGVLRKKIPYRMSNWNFIQFLLFWGGLMSSSMLCVLAMSRLDKEQKGPYQVFVEQADVPGYKVVVCVDVDTEYVGETVSV